jgi:hypothetical protein
MTSENNFNNSTENPNEQTEIPTYYPSHHDWRADRRRDPLRHVHKTALWSFISRNGGADAAHAKYPQLAVALHILKQERKKAKVLERSRRSKPLSRQYADGQSLTEILAPVLQGYRRLYREKFNLDMTPEQVIMFLVATNGVETLEQHGYSRWQLPDRYDSLILSGATPSQSNCLK